MDFFQMKKIVFCQIWIPMEHCRTIRSDVIKMELDQNFEQGKIEIRYLVLLKNVQQKIFLNHRTRSLSVYFFTIFRPVILLIKSIIS